MARLPRFALPSCVLLALGLLIVRMLLVSSTHVGPASMQAGDGGSSEGGLPQASSSTAVEPLRGKVISVSDGDTLKLLVGRDTVTVRLDGIDAPESGQSFGGRAKQALAEAVQGKSVVVHARGTDRYGRTLGGILVDGIDVNAMLVERGWAWHYKQYSRDAKLAALELQARAAKRGLWADSQPLPPWEFRARQRATASGVETTAQTAHAADQAGPAGQTQFWLNTSSGVRHNSRCEHFRNTRAGRFCQPDEGKACGICGG
jgi:micrococcal nuclease